MSFMSAAPAYDANNVFAKILRGEVPSERVYEDERNIAFMDIMPRGRGHVLVIPKAPSRNLLDIGVDDLTHLFRATQLLAGAPVKAYDAHRVTIQQFNEPA